MEILVTIKPQYGCVAYHPDNAEAKALAQIAGTKTLTPRVLSLAKGMGFEVKGRFDLEAVHVLMLTDAGKWKAYSNYMPI
jgi:hypothetical protein